MYVYRLVKEKTYFFEVFRLLPSAVLVYFLCMNKQ